MTVRTGTSATGAAVFVVSLLALELEYPWSTYVAFGFSRGRTLVSYLIVAALVAIATAATSALFLWVPAASARFRSVVCGIVAFGLMSLLGVLFDPVGLEIPGTRVNGIFFSEWKFLNFVFFVAAPAAVATTVICAWVARRRSHLIRESRNSVVEPERQYGRLNIQSGSPLRRHALMTRKHCDEMARLTAANIPRRGEMRTPDSFQLLFGRRTPTPGRIQVH